MPPHAAGLFSAGQRFSVYYFVLFAGVAAIGPFVAVWLDSIGIDARWTGIIVSAPSILMMLTTMRIGRWADTLNDRRTAVLAINAFVFIVNLALWITDSAGSILVVWTLAGIVMMAQVPIVDAMTLKRLHDTDDDFGRIRMFGSVGYVLALLACGSLYDRAGISLFLGVLTLVNLVRLLVSFGLPTTNRGVHAPGVNDSDAGGAESNAGGAESIVTTRVGLDATDAIPVAGPPTGATAASSLYSTGILLTMGGAAAINASHALINTFGILHWKQLGYGESLGSVLFGVGVITEILLMWRFKALTGNVGARHVLLFAAAVGAVRWLVLATDPPLWLLVAAQALHGVTFGMTYIAIANFIARRVPEADAARGQSLNAILQMGGFALSTYVCGLLFERLGASLFIGMAALCGLAAVLILASFRSALQD